MTPTILIAEDEAAIADILTHYLAHEGFEVICVADGQQALAVIESRPVELLLLDVMLPGMMGFDVLGAVRQQSLLPVIVLTSLVKESNRLHGFELGADDYICKPFSPNEVVARVRSVLRRAGGCLPPQAGKALTCDQLVLNEEAYTAVIGTHEITFTPTEFKLLKVFVARANSIFSRDELLGKVTHHFSEASYRAIDSHIKNIRRKMSHAAPHHHIIQSVYGAGYKLNQPFVAKNHQS